MIQFILQEDPSWDDLISRNDALEAEKTVRALAESYDDLAERAMELGNMDMFLPTIAGDIAEAEAAIEGLRDKMIEVGEAATGRRFSSSRSASASELEDIQRRIDAEQIYLDALQKVNAERIAAANVAAPTAPPTPVATADPVAAGASAAEQKRFDAITLSFIAAFDPVQAAANEYAERAEEHRGVFAGRRRPGKGPFRRPAPIRGGTGEVGPRRTGGA